MGVINLLHHHFCAQNLFGMAAFLPELIFPIGSGAGFVGVQFQEHSVGFPLFEVVDDFAGGPGFKVADFLAQVPGRGDEMEVVFHDDVGVERQALVLLKELQGVENDLRHRGAGKEGEPVDDGAGDKVRGLVVHEFVTASSHWFFLLFWLITQSVTAAFRRRAAERGDGLMPLSGIKYLTFIEKSGIL